MKRLTLLLPLISLVSGIIISRLYGSIVFALLLIGCGFLSYWILLNLKRDPVKQYKINKLHYVWVFLTFFGTGMLCYCLNSTVFPQINSIDNTVFIKGKISDIKETTSGETFYLDIFSISDSDGNVLPSENMKLIVYTDNLVHEIDDIVEFQGQIKSLEDSPNSFESDYTSLMNNKGYYHISRVLGKNINKIGHSFSLRGLGQKLRDDIEIKIEKTSLNTTTKEFLITVLLGDRAFLNKDNRELFSNAGIAHVLALSGLHIGIICGIILFLLFPVNFWGLYRYRSLIAVLVLWFYALITGMSPSTVRSCIMATFLMVALFLERKNSGLNALCGAALIILFVSPNTLWDIGFQLSFICVATLLLFATCLNPIDRHLHPKTYLFSNILISILIATGGSWVLTSFYFELFPISFLPANILVLPLLPFYLVIAIVYLIFSFIGIDIWALGWLLDHIYIGFIDLLGIFENIMPPIRVNVNLTTVILWFSGMIAAAVFIHYRRNKFVLYICIGLLVTSLAIIPLDKGNHIENGIIFRDDFSNITLNIRENGKEKILKLQRGIISTIGFKNKKIIVVDTYDNSIKNKISPGKYDYLVIAGGFKGSLSSLIENYHPETIVIHKSVRRNAESRLIEELNEMKCNIHSIRNNSSLKVILD